MAPLRASSEGVRCRPVAESDVTTAPSMASGGRSGSARSIASVSTLASRARRLAKADA